MSVWLPTGYIERSELVIQRSRFVTVLARTDGEAAAREIIATERSTFPDARHHCSAFIVRVPDAMDIERSNDDGEPAGTAGKPMLEVLRGSGLRDVTAVVTRYFGGVLLGTGGLVRAYSDSVSQAIAIAPRVELIERPLFTLALPHAEAGRITAELIARGVDVVGTEYGAEAVLTLVDDGGLVDVVGQLTRGEGRLSPAGSRVVEAARH